MCNEKDSRFHQKNGAANAAPQSLSIQGETEAQGVISGLLSPLMKKLVT